MARADDTELAQDSRFRSFYAQHLQPLEQQFEALRVGAVRERNLRAAASLATWAAAMGGVGWMAWPIGEAWPFFAFAGLAFAVGLGVWAWLPAGAHESRLQDEVLTRIVPFFGELTYKQEATIDPARYREWKILPRYDKVYAQDQIEGRYAGVPFEFAEVTLRYERGRAGETGSQTHTAFDGLMLGLVLETEHDGLTLIRSRGSDMNGRFGVADGLEEVRQGEGFEVLASPGAADVADEGFLSRLAEVASGLGARNTFASFHRNRLVLMIEHDTNLFEMSHREVTDFARDAERIRGELGRIFASVERLELRGGSEPASALPNPDPESDLMSLLGPEHAGGRATIGDRAAVRAATEGEAADPYDVGGWGCLGAFAVFAASVVGFVGLLGGPPSPGRLGWATLGGAAASLGVLLGFRAGSRGSVAGAVFACLCLAGAAVVLEHQAPPPIQEIVREWTPW